MKYRRLGKTECMVSEVAFGGEWMERCDTDKVRSVVEACEAQGINLLDCWMSNPKVRSDLGDAIWPHRDRWFIQGHIGSVWQDGQYVRTRDVEASRVAFEDLLERFHTDYIDFGMIHYVDEFADWENIIHGSFLAFVKELKAEGKIRHIGVGTHNPAIAKLAAQTDFVELIMFSVNPAFDLLPATEHINDYFVDEFDADLSGMDPERADLYRFCETQDVGITCMKGFAGGRLFDEKRSPFGVALTPVQCLHYCLTRPAVGAVLCGYDEPWQVEAACAYETATQEEKDYATVLASAPRHAFGGQCTYCGHCKPCPVNIDIAMVNKLYDLAIMQPQLPASVRSHYQLLTPNASDCLACGACETRCPFGVGIVERMAKAAELFS